MNHKFGTDHTGKNPGKSNQRNVGHGHIRANGVFNQKKNTTKKNKIQKESKGFFIHGDVLFSCVIFWFRDKCDSATNGFPIYR